MSYLNGKRVENQKIITYNCKLCLNRNIKCIDLSDEKPTPFYVKLVCVFYNKYVKDCQYASEKKERIIWKKKNEKGDIKR